MQKAAASSIAAPAEFVSSEEQFRLLADSIPQMAWMADADGNSFWYNRRWYEYTGTTFEQMKGWGWQRVHHPEVLPLVNERWSKALRTGEAMEMEFPLRGADGVFRWFLTRAIPVKDREGNVTLWIGTNTDVTELRQMREELRVFRDRLNLCAEGVELGIWFCDLPFDKLNWSPRVKQHFGLPPDSEVTIQTFWDRLHPDDREKTDQAMRRAIESGAPYDAEYRTIGLDGQMRWIRAIGAAFRDEDGAPRRFDGVTLDITAQKVAEQERQEILQRERASAEMAQLLNQLGPILTAELDLQKLTQKITDVATRLINAQFGALFHNVINELGECYMLYTLSGAPREAFSKFPMPRNTALFGATFSGSGVVRCGDVRKDPRYGHNAPYNGMPKGHLPVCSYLAVPVVSRSGQVLGGLFFGHEQPDRFTEQHEQIVVGIAAQAAVALDNARLFEDTRRAENALRAANEELHRINDDLNQFAHSASHDLREPLRHIIIYSQLLQKRYAQRLDGPGLEYLNHCTEAAKRMEFLLRDLLAYTQALNVSEECLQPIEVNAVVEKAIANLGVFIREAGAEITVGSLPSVHVHEVHLLQLFQNLLSNAIKYRRPDNPCRVIVGASRSDGHWTFSIQDNGIGIDPQYHEQIFGIFKRLHTGDKYSGTGIGLAICEKIVEKYNGRIWLDSELGRGTTFFFTLPAHQG